MFILAGIRSLHQHIKQLCAQPSDYEPEQCPHCNYSGLWQHGCYFRKSDREGAGLGLISIPRFLCSNCRRTCSTLPECIPPRRWYLWQLQETLILLLLQGQSFKAVSRLFLPARSTLRRWWNRLKCQFHVHRDALLGRWSEFGKFSEFCPFWLVCLDKAPLSEAMLIISQYGQTVP